MPSPARPAVLIVEDEPLLRIMAAEMVEEAGFEPVEAADAAEAIGLLEQRPDIRIVFTDIDLPHGIDGMALARAIRERWPPIELILTSGHFAAGELVLPARGLFFAKPYRQDEVIAAMRRMAPPPTPPGGR